jgi:hypothetical protein
MPSEKSGFYEICFLREAIGIISNEMSAGQWAFIIRSSYAGSIE